MRDLIASFAAGILLAFLFQHFTASRAPADGAGECELVCYDEGADELCDLFCEGLAFPDLEIVGAE